MIVVLATSFISNAQDIEIEENFENSILPNGWSSIVNTGSCDINFDSTTPFGPDFNSIAVIFNDDICGDNNAASNVSILSDVYDLSMSNSVIVLQYDVGFIEFNGSTFLVEFFNGTTWEEIILYDESVNGIITESFTIAANNSDFQVRWTYDDADDWGWYGGIDNFKLSNNNLGFSNGFIEGFTFAPNPAQNILNLNSQNDIIDRASIVNILGQTVIETEVKATSSTLDISGLAAGT